jgi:hypothetical protein
MISAYYCDNLNWGGGWALVRHVPAGTTWHPATFVFFVRVWNVLFLTVDFRDDLAGTSEYGDYEANPASTKTFSVAYASNSSTELLLINAARTQYVIMTLGQIVVNANEYTFAPKRQTSTQYTVPSQYVTSRESAGRLWIFGLLCFCHYCHGSCVYRAAGCSGYFYVDSGVSVGSRSGQ